MINKDKLSYYRECYRLDSGELNLWQLNKLAQKDRYIFCGVDELANGFLPHVPLEFEFAASLSKRVASYQRERVLLYCSLIFVGEIELHGETRLVASPLLFSEANIEQQAGEYFLGLDKSGLQLNESLCQILNPELDIAAQFNNSAAPHDVGLWAQWLKTDSLTIDLLPMMSFPQLVGHQSLKQALKSTSACVLPMSMAVFIERPRGSRGVLHELDQLIAAPKFSSCLQALFGNTTKAHVAEQLKYDYLPGLLSHAQKQTIAMAAQYPLGCVSGPPGTGKSYTIAAVAAEHIARGKSVLIMAANDSALNVISDKLEQEFGLGDISIRSGQSAFLKQLKVYLDDLLAGFSDEQNPQTVKQAEKLLRDINRILEKLEKRFDKFCRKAIVRGQRLKALEQHKSKWLRRVYLTFVSRNIHQLSQQWVALEQINECQRQREKLAAAYLTAIKNINLQQLLNNHRKTLQAFNKAIRSRTSQRQFEWFDAIEYQPLLSAFPIWLVSLNSLHQVLPMKAEMFDLLIIDEATQANISSCLGAFQRAKNALVVGDGKQLRHYSFLSKSKQAAVMKERQLDENMPGVMSYRDCSILDLTLSSIESQQQAVLLNEHFRSKPQLIHFSNQQFYHGKLKVMQHRPCTSSGHLHLLRVQGKRDKKGINEVEAQQVIEEIQQYIQQDSLQGFNHSIGVISPFRQQADYLDELIAEKFSPIQIAEHQIKVSTPYGFQGEERDIVLISFTLDDEAKRAASYLNKADVFNVTITRARQSQILLVSMDETKLPTHNLFRQYIESIEDFSVTHNANTDIDSFQQAVCQALQAEGIETWTGYTMIGVEIDILCRYQQTYLAIDLIGYPGPWQDYFELDSYKLFNRAGVNILPISYGLWVVDPSSCIAHVIELLRSPK